VASISGSNHWWQNWSKTHAYVAERMFFPRRPEDIADAVRGAEADQRSLRAVGGGWSFSDASLPGSVSTGRPNVHVIDACAAALPRTVTFPSDPTAPSVGSVPAPARDTDASGSMVMVADPGSLETHIDPWAYAGAGTWTYGQWTYPANDPQTLSYFAQAATSTREISRRLTDASDPTGRLGAQCGCPVDLIFVARLDSESELKLVTSGLAALSCQEPIRRSSATEANKRVAARALRRDSQSHTRLGTDWWNATSGSDPEATASTGRSRRYASGSPHHCCCRQTSNATMPSSRRVASRAPASSSLTTP
jgi:hypothetical protein